MSTVLAPPAPDPWAVAADIIDPPEWEPKDRPEPEAHQLPPEGEWDLWLLEAGRGAGKTEACSRYFTKYMRAHPGHRGRIIAPTYDDAVASCVKGPSGLLQVDPELRMVVQPGGTHIIWPNGSEALVLGTHGPGDVDRLRASGNRHIDWWEEMAANPQLGDPLDTQGAWNQAQLGLRLGDHPHSIASTTPRSTKAYRAVRKEDGTVLTKASMFDNPHLPDAFIKRMKAKYEGTRLGRQELYGELLEDVVGALWTRERLDASRVQHKPDMAIVELGVDPAATATETSDDTGIIVAGLGVDGYGYVWRDETCHLSPAGWGDRVVTTYHQETGDLVVGEVNNGGDMVQHVVHSVDDTVPFKKVHASRGKAIRAQPIATMWGKPKDDYGPEKEPAIRIVGSLPELEDQLVTWVPGEEDSPDRLDAMVWVLTDLMLEQQEEEETYEYYQPKRIGADI